MWFIYIMYALFAFVGIGLIAGLVERTAQQQLINT